MCFRSACVSSWGVAACCYLEAENDGPDEAQCQAMVSVHNVVGAHVFQVNPLLLQELQSFVHVLQTVNTHPTFGGLWLQTEEQTTEPQSG